MGPLFFVVTDAWRTVLNRRSGRLLLRHAVHRTQTPDEVSGIDGHNLAGREQLNQCVERDAVVRAIEDRSKYDSVGDVKVSVTGRKAPAFEDDGLRHGQLDHRQLPAILVARGLQAAKVGTQLRVVNIFGIRFYHGDDSVFRNEASQVVDVAVSVIAEDAATEPDSVRRAEVI